MEELKFLLFYVALMLFPPNQLTKQSCLQLYKLNTNHRHTESRYLLVGSFKDLNCATKLSIYIKTEQASK